LTIQLQSDTTNPGPSLPEEGYVSARNLLVTGRPFTALFAFNDVSAIGAMRAFREAGHWIPENISVVGFDDIHVATYVTPQLTTLRQPLRQMGELAARQLLDQISNPNLNGPRSISVPPQLIVRESTGPVPHPRR
jgi:LacI family transcriptional regulator